MAHRFHAREVASAPTCRESSDAKERGRMSGILDDDSRPGYILLAPSFECGSGRYIHHQTFESNVILPFTYYSQRSESGAFGQVSKVKIHPDHHRHPPVNQIRIRPVVFDAAQTGASASGPERVLSSPRVKAPDDP